MLIYMIFKNEIHISGERDKWKIPLVYVLCCEKNTATYRTIFGQIKKKQPQFNPLQINVDFEQAAIKALKEIFPNAHIQGCHFHFSKNIVQNLGKNGLKTRYEQDGKFAHEIRKMIALPFIPAAKIVEACEYFVRNSEFLNKIELEKDINVKNFTTDYFENHYIGKMKKNGKRGKPQFDIQLWNVHNSTVNDRFSFPKSCFKFN